MRNFLVILLLSFLLTGLEFSEAGAAASSAPRDAAAGLATAYGVTAPATKRICWRKVLPPAPADMAGETSSPCGGGAKHPCEVSVFTPAPSRAFRIDTTPPRLFGRSGVGLFRPPIS